MSDIVGKLWGFCHTLRHDGIDYGDYIEQLTYLLFLKMIEEKGAEIPSDYSWNILREKSGTDLTDHYIDTLRALGKEKNMLGDIIVESQIQDKIRGQTRPGINGKILKAIAIPTPPLREQEEIIHRVRSLFKLADTIEKHLAAAKARAEKLTQSALAKAFQGELVPTEAELARQEGRSYEPAPALLDKIRAQKKDVGFQRKRGRTLQRKNNISDLTS